MHREADLAPPSPQSPSRALSARTGPLCDPSDRLLEASGAKRARSPATATARSSGGPRTRTVDTSARAPDSRAVRGATAAVKYSYVYMCDSCGWITPSTRRGSGGSCSARCSSRRLSSRRQQQTTTSRRLLTLQQTRARLPGASGAREPRTHSLSSRCRPHGRGFTLWTR